jgi:hypothetical protein
MDSEDSDDNHIGDDEEMPNMYEDDCDELINNQ